MYHVLVFQKGGKFNLDSEGDEEPIIFDTMDELVSFLIGHDLKVNEDEVHLQYILPCDMQLTQKARISSNGEHNGLQFLI